MLPPIAGFDWDSGNREKCRVHGVAAEDIEAAFATDIWAIPDPAHSDREDRFKGFGTDASGRTIFVAFTLRQSDRGVPVRPISARYMHRKEIRHYEEQKAKAEEAARTQKR
jgi:uncharacterized DUF497 family protein